jgi:hypothetical protein
MFWLFRKDVMRKRQGIWLFTVWMCALSGACAQDNQDNSLLTPEAFLETSLRQAVPAYGQENSPSPTQGNAPLAGLDVPSLEPGAAHRNYFQTGATFNQSGNSNAGSALGGQQFTSITRGLGSVALHRVRGRYDLGLDYVGGVAYYSLQSVGAQVLQQLDFDEKISWKRGELSLRDSFSYLPEGDFGATYGSLGSEETASIGSSSFGAFFGGSALGTFGLVPRVVNVSLADVSEALTPKSTFTGEAGYAFTHFYGGGISTATPFISTSQFVGSSEISTQTSYNRTLTQHTQVAMLYGYQGFDFSVTGLAFHSHVIEGMYGRRITGRMDLLIAAGPQFTRINVACTVIDALSGNPRCGFISSGGVSGSIPDHRLGVAGQLRLRYRFSKASLDLSYQRYETGGTGLFAGAQSDIGQLSAERRLSRVYRGFVDLGYSRNSRLQSADTVQGVNANVYSYAFMGLGVRRPFGHNLNLFGSYQFNELLFDHSLCGGVGACNRISNQHVITFGLDWIFRPIRLG